MKKKDVFAAMLMAVAMMGTGLSCSNDKEDLDLTVENENENDTPQVEVEEEELADSTDFSISLGDVPTGYNYKKPENSNPNDRHRTPPRVPSL